MSEEYRVEISKTVSVVAPDEESAVKNAVSQTKRDVTRNAPGYFVDSFNFTVVGAQDSCPDDCEKCEAADEAGDQSFGTPFPAKRWVQTPADEG